MLYSEVGSQTFSIKREEGTNHSSLFLMTIEYYYQWYKAAAAGIPSCTDKSRVYDFTGTSIEHVYPRKASPPDATLEPLKNTLGNLTIMDPEQNSTGGNDDFATKKPIYDMLLCRIDSRDWSKSRVDPNRNLGTPNFTDRRSPQSVLSLKCIKIRWP